MHEKAIQCTPPKETCKACSNHGEDAALCDIEGLVHEVLAREVYLSGQLDAICEKAADKDGEQSLRDFAESLEMQEVIDVQVREVQYHPSRELENKSILGTAAASDEQIRKTRTAARQPRCSPCPRADEKLPEETGNVCPIKTIQELS